MSNTNAMVDSFKSLAAQYQSVIDLANKLAELGSIEQAIIDCTTAANNARSDREQALQDLQSTNALLAQAKDDLQSATDKANQIIIEANDQAGELLTHAHDQVASLKKEAVSLKEDVMAEVKSASDRLAETNAAIALKQTELADLEQKIADTKAAALAALGV